ncbi:hypothetical protein EVAR_32796_1 [Eumeta japonica]|uniref:Reverse transcriptase/retrotransposon-derived protein RNase H-like domain-containing protein n=1 Tax=Eumeta variegata TaxID=151549 RepID=A0A4C1WCJ9_EUMVA|nr:hypothetical protein EVAR_32796_1 [Eumeta japonica]
MCEKPVCGYPDEGKEFIFDTDASNTDTGGILLQIKVDRELMIAYFSASGPRAHRCRRFNLTNLNSRPRRPKQTRARAARPSQLTPMV